MRTLITTFCSLIAFCGVASSQQTAGMIVGTVVDDDGRAVARAIVRFAKLAEYSRDNQGKARLADVGFQGSVNTNEDGTFRILGLPSGRYKVCAYDSGSKGLTGCAWEPSPVVTVGLGEVVSGIRLSVLESVRLFIRVDDSYGRISLPDSQGRVLPEQRFFVGVVSSSGIYRPASLIAIDGSFKVFAVAVPRRQSVGLFIDSELTVRDHLGRIVPKREIASGLVPVGALDEVTVELNVR